MARARVRVISPTFFGVLPEGLPPSHILVYTSPLNAMRQQVEEKGFAVVVVAEGAGEELLGESTSKDASGCVGQGVVWPM